MSVDSFREKKRDKGDKYDTNDRKRKKKGNKNCFGFSERLKTRK